LGGEEQLADDGRSRKRQEADHDIDEDDAVT
jgi:hypothetical protein